MLCTHTPTKHSTSIQVENITLNMPNVHNLPFDLARMGLKNTDHTGNIDILYPIDEPHGIIQVTALCTALFGLHTAWFTRILPVPR
jgi:hypothetical protein